MELVIEPYFGIGPIRFGISRDEVHDEMGRFGEGRPRPRGKNTECYFGDAFQVSFGDDGLSDLIELASGIGAEVWFEALDVFDTPADVLLAAVSRLDKPALELSLLPQSYVFPDLILALWGRDKQYDHRRGQSRPMFGAVGVGAPSYLAAIRAIRSGRDDYRQTGPGRANGFLPLTRSPFDGGGRRQWACRRKAPGRSASMR